MSYSFPSPDVRMARLGAPTVGSVPGILCTVAPKALQGKAVASYHNLIFWLICWTDCFYLVSLRFIATSCFCPPRNSRMAAVTLTNAKAISEIDALVAVRKFLGRRVPASVAYTSSLPALSDDVHAHLTRVADELERYTGGQASASAGAATESSSTLSHPSKKSKKRERESAESGSSEPKQKR